MVHMAILPLDHLLIATSFMRQALQILAAGATFTRVLEFIARGATLPQIRNLMPGTPVNTTRNRIGTPTRNLILGQKVAWTLLLVLTVSNCDFVLSLLC